MKLALKIAAVVVALLVTLYLAQAIASEQGEVVVLTTFDVAGGAQTTRVWVVDYEGAAWLRSGSPASAWYGRIGNNPQVKVVRGGREFAASVVAVPDQQKQINQLMAEKYGWADQFIGLLFGRDDAIALRLDPVTGVGPQAAHIGGVGARYRSGPE